MSRQSGAPGQEVAEARFVAAFPALFGGMTGAKAALLLSRTSYREVEEGTVMLREGQSCPLVPFVIAGCLRVFRVAENGREITLYRVEEGQSCIVSTGCVDSMASFPATVVAERPASLAFMPSSTAREFFDGNAAFRNFVLSQFASRMTEIMELVEEVAFRRVDERLRDWLARESASGRVSSTHREIADHLGTSREVVSRILKDWELRGFLSLARGEIALSPSFGRLSEPDGSD